MRQNIDHAMIAVLIAITYIPYWGTQLPMSELRWRVPVVVLLLASTVVLRCTHTRLRDPSAILYLVLGGFGCVLSFNEAQSWLPLVGQVLFWSGIVCYVVQFLIWARNWPNPIPGLFGYQEVQHVVLLCGTTLHTIVVLNYLVMK